MMKEKTKNIICLSILIIVPIILLILCGTGYSCRKDYNRENFLSSITDYFKKPNLEDHSINSKLDNSKNNIPIEQATVVSNKAPFPPADNSDDFTEKNVKKSNLPNMDHDYNKYSLNDLENNFKPNSISVHKNPGNTLLDKNNNKSLTHQNINSVKDGLIRPNKIINADTKEVPILNPLGAAKAGPGLLEKDEQLFNVISNSFKFFDANYTPDNKKYVYTGAEIGFESDVPISFNCEGGKKSENAEAVAKIDSDGKVSDIILLKKGYGYKKAKVNVIGGEGKGCKAKAVVNDNSTISHIEVTNGGMGYKSTPNISISSPNQNKKCKLFFKKNK